MEGLAALAGRPGADAVPVAPAPRLNAPWGQSQSCTSCGKCVQVCPTGALFEKIRPKAEMVKNRDFLVYLKTAREKKLWIR